MLTIPAKAKSIFVAAYRRFCSNRIDIVIKNYTTCAAIMFKSRASQNELKVDVQAVKSDVPDRFFTKSDELEILGKTVLGKLNKHDLNYDSDSARHQALSFNHLNEP